MWKPSKMLLAAALIVMLLCGTAFAVAGYYSVRDYFADKHTSLEFEENIIPLEEQKGSTGLSFFLGDAVFDGRDLVFTMNVKAEAGIQALYVFPRLQAFCNGQALSVTYEGSTFLSFDGSFMPHPDYPLDGVGDQGVEAYLDEEAAGAVTWRYTLELYRPLGEVVTPRDWEPEAESYAEWQEYLRGLAREGKIGCLYGSTIFDWLHAVSGSDKDETFTQRMEATGLFELADTVVFEFTTAVPEGKVLISGVSFPFDGYTVTVDSLTQSFLQLDYALTVTFDERYEGHEHYLDHFYELSDQDGVKLRRRTALLELAEDRMSCTVTGSVEYISDDPITAVTFTRKVHDWPDDQFVPAFTVDLTQ